MRRRIRPAGGRRAHAVKLETKKTLDLVQFVEENEIPPLYYDAPYFVAPADELRKTLPSPFATPCARQESRLGQLALPQGIPRRDQAVRKGCCSKRCTTRKRSRSPTASSRRFPPNPPTTICSKSAAALIEKKTDKFDPKIFKDHYQAALAN